MPCGHMSRCGYMYVHACVYGCELSIGTYICIYTPNPSAWGVCDTRSIFKRSLTGLNSVFRLLDYTKTKALSLPDYLLIAGGRIIRFIPFPRVLVLCEMQTASSSIWTRAVVSISYKSNIYITSTSIKYVYMCISI